MLKNKYTISVIILSILYALFFALWLFANYLPFSSIDLKEFFTDTYGVLALLGSILGFFISRRWGYPKSVLGKSLFFLSLGLFLQFLGQFLYTCYALLLQVEVPYPSWGDVGYFGSIPAYAYAVYLIAHVCGFKFSLGSYLNRVWVVLIPSSILLTSYFIFLHDYDYSETSFFSIKFLLDFGYPLGQAFYLSLAILTFILTRGYLGGALRKGVLILLVALLTQYFADFLFLYKQSRGIWEAGGVSDLAYLLAYWIMTVAVLSFNDVYLAINKRGNDK